MLLAETAKYLIVFERYCKEWKLQVKLKKTKEIIFPKRKSNLKPEFKLFNENLNILCDTYTYSGVVKFNLNCLTLY